MKNLHTEKTSNGSRFGWLIRQMSVNQKSGRKTFRGRFVSGSIFVSPCPPECYFQSEMKIEPDLGLPFSRNSRKSRQFLGPTIYSNKNLKNSPTRFSERLFVKQWQ